MNNQKKMKAKSKIVRSSVFMLVLSVLLGMHGCARNQAFIKSNIDKDRGIWIDHKNGSFEYRISAASKEEVLKNIIHDNAQWRNEKIAVALFYISDIDNSFLSIGQRSAGFKAFGDNVIIEGKEQKYDFGFEKYHSIYFPRIVKIIKSK